MCDFCIIMLRVSKLDELYEQHNFDLLIKLVGDSHDPKERFLVLSSLVIQGKRKEALDEIDHYQAILETSHPFELMKMHFELLLSEKLYDEARIKLRHYENLPYISQEVEEFLREMKVRIEDEAHAKKGSTLIPLDEVYETLETGTNQSEIAQTIFQLKNYNINLLIDSLRIFLKRKEVHPNFRTYVLIYLVDQKYNSEIEVLTRDKIITVNPSKIVPPFMHEDFNEVCRQITIFSEGDTSITETALHLFNCYILDTYPEDIYQDGIIELAQAFVYIALTYLKQKPSFSSSLAKKIQEILETTEPIKLN